MALSSVSVDKVRAAGFIIYRTVSKQIEYLLLQASYGDHHWTPPKGHLEDGESDKDAAYRETLEEAGINKDQLTCLSYQKTLYYTVKGREKQVVYWLAKLNDNSATIRLSNEHQEFKWGEIKEAKELSRYLEMQELLQDCDEFLKKEVEK